MNTLASPLGAQQLGPQTRWPMGLNMDDSHLDTLFMATAGVAL